MEVFGLGPTFHVSVPLLVFSSEWLAGSLGPPSRKPPPSRSRATQHLREMTLFVPFARSESYLRDRIQLVTCDATLLKLKRFMY